jgi:hypothetical protein
MTLGQLWVASWTLHGYLFPQYSALASTLVQHTRVRDRVVGVLIITPLQKFLAHKEAH